MTGLACVIPFFNGSGTLPRALDSVLRSPLCTEIVIVSDASSEPVRDGLDSQHLRAEQTGRIRLIELKTNVGQAIARNIGVACCTAPWLTFLDQDDEVLDDFHPKAIGALNHHPMVAAVEVNAEIVMDGCSLLELHDPRFTLVMDSVPWNVLVRRSAFWTCGGFPTLPIFRTEAAGEDIAFKSALKACFQVPRLAIDGIRHHVRRGSATDRFLSRTSVTPQGAVLFHSRYPVELDGSLDRAIKGHVLRALDNRASSQVILGSAR